jgi:hypothetical protein
MRNQLRLGLVPAMAAALVLFATSLAYADAVGSTPIGAFDYTFQGAKLSIPTGSFFTHMIRGSGLTITDESAGVDGIGPGLVGGGFCNWRIDFQYEDDSGKVYSIDRGPLSNTCDHYTFRDLPVTHALPSYGKACALFYVNGVERARQCHFIVKA